MDHPNLPESKQGSCVDTATVDSGTSAGALSPGDDSEFTERELALMDQWDRAAMPTPDENERFQARLRAALDAADESQSPSSTERASERAVQASSKPRK